MLDITDGYKHAIVGDVRRMLIKAIIDISDPDMVFGDVASSGEASFSKEEQLHDKTMELESRYATLEPNRWVLDGSFRLIPDDPVKLTGEVGHVGDLLSGDDGSFASPVWAELAFSNVSILQACSVYFSQDAVDGVAEDFTVAVYSGPTAVYTKTFTGNNAVSVSLDGFTVYDPTAIRVTVTKWSLPGRRMRIAEIIPGIYEEWTEDVLASLDIQMRGNFSCLAIPYGVATLRMDNLDRRFEPRNRAGIFQSIEERQGIPIALGVELGNGSVEYTQVGVFYQANGGWRTSDNEMTMQWEMVDIIGLISEREFILSGSLPTTLGGWVQAIVNQLGTNFADKWQVDENYAGLTVNANNEADVIGQKCGDILRWACMATGTWPRADAKTGFLTVEPFWNVGNKYDLDNMPSYPTMRANDDLAVLTFKLYDEAETVYNISGNATSSSNTITVSNPFIHTKEQAMTAARQILSQYGGIKLELTGRGNPSSEIGDVDTVWLDESVATTGRRMEQSFSFTNGVLSNCKSVLLQADGSFLFENRKVFTESGTFTGPAGVTTIRLILVSKGGDGADGTDGTWDAAGVDGEDGCGGKVWSGEVNINAGQTYTVNVGDESIFGAYSSANGKVYPNGFTDIKSGDSYGRTGVTVPKSGTGDGGVGGRGGIKGNRHTETHKDSTVGGSDITATVEVVDNYPTNGTKGVAGASGCVVVYWDKVNET